MNDTTTSCPHCGVSAARKEATFGDYAEFHCPSCGDYRLSGTSERLIETGAFDAARDGRFETISEVRWLMRPDS
jgi:predicted RNA-binding Zn-ribbon protein involved in translation (DUF1610 family)